MSIRKIEKEIRAIAATLKATGYDSVNETTTEESFVKPFLRAFGWDTSDIEKVVLQHPIKIEGEHDKYPDYALLKDSEIKTIIEAKRVGEPLLKHIPQLKKYVEEQKPHIGVLTNGQQWWFFSWHRVKKEMNERPFAVIDITDLRLRNEDSFLLHFRQNKFDADYFKAFSHADYLSSRAHGTTDMEKDPAIKRYVKKIFFRSCKLYRKPIIPGSDEYADGSKWSRKQIRYLWKYSQHHSRWAFSNYKTRVKPMRK